MCQAIYRLDHERWFVAFAAKGHRCQIRTIRLHQKPVFWCDPRCLPHTVGLRKRQYPTEGQMETDIERFPRLLLIPGETMHDSRAPPLRTQCFHCVTPCLTGENHHWLANLRRHRELCFEHITLDVSRRQI